MGGVAQRLLAQQEDDAERAHAHGGREQEHGRDDPRQMFTVCDRDRVGVTRFVIVWQSKRGGL